MIASPYDGESRTLLRCVLALVALADLGVLAYLVATTEPSGLSHPFAPGWLLALGGSPLWVALVALPGALALARFAWRPRALGAAAIAIVALAILCEAHASLIEGPMRIFFTSGAMLAGWALGLWFARSLGSESERLAELGAVGALSATYVGAATSKLLASGLSWADANTLRALVFSQRRLEGHSPFDFYARAIGEQPWIPYTLAMITLFVQAGALLYPLGPRLRMVIGTLLLVFHVNVWLLTPILFPQAMALLIAFSYPWPRWLRRLRGRPQPEPESDVIVADGPRLRRASLHAALPLIVLAAVLAWPDVRRYAAVQHDRRLEQRSDAVDRPVRASAPPAPADVVALLGGLAPGDSLADLTVVSIGGPVERGVSIEVARGELRFRIRVTPRGASAMRAPLSSERYDLFYEHVRPSEGALSAERRDAALGAIRQRLSRTEHEVPRPAGM